MGRVSTQLMNQPYHYLSALGLASVLGLTNIVAQEVDININGTTTYVPFAAGLSIGQAVYLDANTNPASTDLRATQRDLGYREVDYKAALFNTLTGSTAASTVTSGSITTVNYTGINVSKNSSTILGYWAAKDVPIVIGTDGKAYITDGHHTTAGFLETTGSNLTAGTSVTTNHIVIGHVVASYYTGTPVAPTDANFWNAMSAKNNAYLYGSSGNPLGGGHPPIPADTTAVPQIPGRAAAGVGMVDDTYRSLTWGMADGVVTASSMKFNTYNSSGASTGLGSAKTTGYLKVDSTNTNYAAQPDVNFVEFYYADYLRNRVTWDNSKTGSALNSGQSDANLIKAPIGFYAAIANGNAMARSEAYKDQNGKNVSDYVSSADSNVSTWAKADIRNGLATSGDTYNLFIFDDSGFTGAVTPSALSTNTLNVNVTSDKTIDNAISNVTSLKINAGGSITTKWKDAAMNGQNSTLTYAAGSGAVTFTGDNNYSRLTSLQIANGSLHIANPIDATIGAALTGSGALLKEGSKTLNLTGNNTAFTGATTVVDGLLKINGAFGGAVTVQNGASLGGSGTFNALATIDGGGHLAPGNSPGTITFANGLSLDDGAILDLQLGITSSDKILVTGGTFSLNPGLLGGFTINIADAGDFGAGPYTLIDYSSGATLGSGINVGDFHLGSTIAGYDYAFTINNNTLQLNITASAIPEPSTYGAIAGAVILATALIRRRRQALV